MLKALEKRLRVPENKIHVSIDRYGNTTISSIPVTLCAANQNKAVNLDRVVFCAFGNGLACTAMALSLKNTYFCKLFEL